MPPPPTHFLCIPLGGQQLARSLAAFREDVTSPLTFAVPSEAVRPLGTLHLTLGVMNLADQTSLSRAVELLRSLQLGEMLSTARSNTRMGRAAQDTGTTVSAGGESPPGLHLSVQGLQPMQEASRTSVLYAPPVNDGGVLYGLCGQIRGAFQEAGLMIDDARPLLLHLTVVNTVYVRGGRSGGARVGRGNGRGAPRKGRERLTLDAQDVLAQYQDYMWAEDVRVERLAICRMGARKIEGADDEAYEVEAQVPL